MGQRRASPTVSKKILPKTGFSTFQNIWEDIKKATTPTVSKISRLKHKR
jgi:hypothetical protein